MKLNEVYEILKYKNIDQLETLINNVDYGIINVTPSKHINELMKEISDDILIPSVMIHSLDPYNEYVELVSKLEDCNEELNSENIIDDSANIHRKCDYTILSAISGTLEDIIDSVASNLGTVRCDNLIGGCEYSEQIIIILLNENDDCVKICNINHSLLYELRCLYHTIHKIIQNFENKKDTTTY